jgi:hypothetical protein
VNDFRMLPFQKAFGTSFSCRTTIMLEPLGPRQPAKLMLGQAA